MFLYTDLEANGLNPDTIWMVCVNDRVFTDREEFAKFVESSKEETWVFHNGIGFDIPVLAKVWNINIPKEKVVDTLVLGRLADPNRDGGHSLRAYGNTLGFEKGDHSDWSRLSDEMITYCLRDVAVTKAVHEHLIKDKLIGFSQESIDLEHNVAWIISKQERNGWLLDQEKCMLLLCKLKERQIELEGLVLQTFVPRANFVKVVEPKFTKDGHCSKVGLGHLGEHWADTVGPHSRIDWPEFNLGSRQQIGKYLQAFGWKPKVFTETGQPKVDEKTLEGVEIPEAQLIAEYLMIQKRLAMVKSWIDAVDPEDDRVHGKVNPNGAVTGRMTHNSPNMAQVTANGKPYGEECRECWAVPKGYKLVGADASGLELRMLAHYMKDDEYTKEILGGDVHSANQRAAGLETRNQAKTFIYAFLYGAGDEKIGSIVGKGREAGRKLKEKFLSNTPALANLRDKVSQKATQGFLKGLDGRRVYIRSEHAALNTLLQSAGAIVMKKALCILDEYAILWNIDYKFVGNIHDEWQVEVREDQAEKFGFLAVECIKAAGIQLKLNCPLDGEYNVGNNWKETH